MMKCIVLCVFMFCGTVLQAQKNLPVLIKGDFGFTNVKTNTGKGSSTLAFGIGAETFIPVVSLGQDISLDINPNLSYLHTGYETSLGGDVRVNYISLAAPVILHPAVAALVPGRYAGRTRAGCRQAWYCRPTLRNRW